MKCLKCGSPRQVEMRGFAGGLQLSYCKPCWTGKNIRKWKRGEEIRRLIENKRRGIQ